MPVYKRKKMCKECPFRANAPRGWLGPRSVDEYVTIILLQVDLICHASVGKLKKEGLRDREIEKQGQHCVGLLRYMNACFTQSRDPEKRDAQQDVKKVIDLPIIPAPKFREYHTI